MSGYLSNLVWTFILLSAPAMLWTGCSRQAHKSPPSPPASLEINTALRNQLQTNKSLPVEGMQGPGGSAFSVAQRTDKIGQYPCQSCHTTPLDKPEKIAISKRWMHTDIQLHHASFMTCQTCHNYDQMQTLTVANDNTPLSFDHSYQQCGQCHFQQLRDWQGGAHGKRLGGWQGKRVVQNCTGCHNPHAPAFAQRTPMLFPRVPRTGQNH